MTSQTLSEQRQEYVLQALELSRKYHEMNKVDPTDEVKDQLVKNLEEHQRICTYIGAINNFISKKIEDELKLYKDV